MQGKNWNESEKKLWSVWFEIPVTDFERAKSFYETIFKTTIITEDFGNFKMGIFPHKEVGCALCFGQGYKPGQNGLLVYMNAEPDLNSVLDCVEKAGGKVVREKRMIAQDLGFMAVLTDSEGNRIALHSSN